jgi:hypothetical protein
MTLLGKRGAQKVGAALEFLITEHLACGGQREDDPGVLYLRALPVEAWDKDEHFLLGAEIAWP